MDSMIQDLRYTVRALRRTPGFTLVVWLTLALGIGAATLVFSVVNRVLLRPLPLPDADRLLLVWTRSSESPQSWLSLPEFNDLRETSTAFADLAALRDWSFNVTGAGEPEQVMALAVSANLFSVLGVQPAMGRAFRVDEDRPGGERVALLSHGFWQRHCGGDPGVIGRALSLDGEPHTIIGVLPAGFRLLPPSSVFPRDVAVWVPLETVLTATHLRNRDVRHLHVLGRLKPDVTTARAGADVATIAARLRQEYPGVYADPGWGMSAVTFQEQIVRGVRPALLILFGAVGLLLLLVCANVANLLLARNAGRAREMAIRASLGASRGRIVRQLLTESLALALLGGLAGVAIATLGVDVLRAFGPATLPRLDEVGVDGWVLSFSLAAALGTALLFGLIPALQAVQHDPTVSIRDGGYGSSTGPHRTRTRRGLVATELALAVVLLAGTGLLTKSLLRLQTTSVGFDARNVLTLRLVPPEGRYPTGEERAALLTKAAERIAQLPGVRAVGAVTQLPLSGATLASGFASENGNVAENNQNLSADLRGVTPDYFRAMGIPLLRGRGFSSADTRDAPWVAVVDETLAARLWPGEDPIGKRLHWQRAPDQPLEVIGMATAVKHHGPGAVPRETVYRPYAQYAPPTPVFLTVRGALDPLPLASAIRAEIHDIDPNLPISDLQRMEQRVTESVAQPRFQTLLLALFAAVALGLAALGIYGVISFSVAQRTRELGIRAALGAQRVDLLRLVLGEGVALALIGIGAGLIAALIATRALTGLLYEVRATDPTIFATVPLLLVAVALLAAYLPARRATRVDPLVALRAE